MSPRQHFPQARPPRRLVAALAALGLLAAVPALGVGTPADAARPMPVSEPTVDVIVELERTPALLAEPTLISSAGNATIDPDALARIAAARTAVERDQRDFLDAVHEAGLRVDEHRALTDLFNGVALTIAETEIAAVERLPGVVAVHPDDLVAPHVDVSVPLVGAPEVWALDDPGGTPVRGAGMTVAIIDSGIDYNLSSLGGGFGPGYKVVDGYDFNSDDADPMDGPAFDSGHGTHVAGIIAGNGAIEGVAPEAQLTAWRVFGDAPTTESMVIEAMAAAVDPASPHRADVVNMSLGAVGDGTDPIGQAASAAVETGVVVVASAGNSGPGRQTITSPAAADGVIAVGASTSNLRLPTARLVEPRDELLQARRAAFSANPPAAPVQAELVDVGYGTPEEYDAVGDVTGKVVAYEANLPEDLATVQPFMLEQAQLAEDRGAVGVFGYLRGVSGPFSTDHLRGEREAGDAATDREVTVPLLPFASGDDFRMDEVVVMAVDEFQWAELESLLAQGTVTVEISGADVTDRLASFSSRGPSSRFSLKPDIVAPGVEIRSTWPTAQWEPGEYRLSGTSMASPHVAGAAALLRQLHPQELTGQVNGRLVGAATGLADTPVKDQGAGRLDVAAAAMTTLTASPATLSLGLADLGSDAVAANGTVRLHNSGTEAVSVDLRIETSADDAGTATVTPAQASIPAGGEIDVTLQTSAPRPEVDAEVSGWLIAEPAGDLQDLRVPYLLAVRPLAVQASPDPTAGESEVFVYSATALSRPPTVTVTTPDGDSYDVSAALDHDTWYRAAVSEDTPGTYHVAAGAWTADGVRLVGASAFEVVAAPATDARTKWAPVGPNSEAGTLATSPSSPDKAAVNQYTKLEPWLTFDGGAHWSQGGGFPVAAGRGAVIIDRDDGDRMWYAVNSSTGGFFGVPLDPTYVGKMLRTDDAGGSWTSLDFPDVHVNAFVADEATDALAAVSADRVLVSRDGGDSWVSYAASVGEVRNAAFQGDDLFLQTFDAVWVLRGIASGTPAPIAQVLGGDQAPSWFAADEHMLAVLTTTAAVLGSTDGGDTWTELHQVDGYPQNLSLAGGDLYVATAIAGNIVGRDYGQTWEPLEEPVFGAIETQFVPWPGDGSSLAVVSEGAGLFQTEPDGSDAVRIGVQGTTAYDLVISPDADGRPHLIAGTDYDTYRTPMPTGPVTTETAEWGLSGSEAYVGTRVPLLTTSAADPQVVWKIRSASTVGQLYLYRSPDGGITWEQRGQLPGQPLDLLVHPTDDDRIVIPFGIIGRLGLYVTEDGGATWEARLHDQIFETVAADSTAADRLWLGSSAGLFRSDDFGATVTQVLDGPVTAVSVVGPRIVVGGETIRVSDDGGTTFSDTDSGGLPMLVSDIVASSSERGVLYASTTTWRPHDLVKDGRGVLRSTDGGHSWLNISYGLQNLSLTALTISPDGRWLFAGAVDGGVHRLGVSGRAPWEPVVPGS